MTLSNLPQKRFSRCIEDFSCEYCGIEVEGNGYTNHCPSCLWSKHVDITPGDRQEECQGMMEPVSIESKRGEYIILHKCKRCSLERKNKTAPNDDFDTIIKVSKQMS